MVTLLQLALLLQVDDFRVVDTDGASKSLGSHDFVNKVHGLGWELDTLNGLMLAEVRVEEADGVRVHVVEGTGWDKVNLVIGSISCKLSFGAYRDCLISIES